MSTYVDTKTKFTVICKKHGAFYPTFNRLTSSGSGCPNCAAHTSKLHQELLDYIKAKAPALLVFSNYTKLPGITELDIYLPELNLGLEINGFYWHSTRTKAKDYHRNKWNSCKAQGISLVSIWDFLYLKDKQKYLAMLDHKLHLSSRVFARNTRIQKIPRAFTRKFLADNHIEGCPPLPTQGLTCLGLIHNDRCVMVAAYTDTSVIRVATKQGLAVVGGVSRLTKQCKSGCVFFLTNDTGAGITLKGWESIPYFSSRYYWVKSYLDWFPRRRCTKKEIAKRWGLTAGSETAIMSSLGYQKCLDSGLTKLVKN